mgnify:CR=1 FL=1
MLTKLFRRIFSKPVEQPSFHFANEGKPKESFNDWFKRKFYLDMSSLTITQKGLTHIPQMGLDLFGSTNALETPYVLSSHIHSICQNDIVINDYFMFGYWGHGINSYAIYYVWIDKGIKVFLRLPYGGVYMENEVYRGFIPKLLVHVEKMIRRAEQESATLTFINCSDEGLFNKNGLLEYFGKDSCRNSFNHIFDDFYSVMADIEALLK